MDPFHLLCRMEGLTGVQLYPEWPFLLLYFFAGLLSFAFSTVTAGGGAMMLVPVSSLLLQSPLVAPLITFVNLIARPSRAWMFRKHIDYSISWRYLLTAIPAALLAVFLFGEIEARWIGGLIGAFLLSNALWMLASPAKPTIKVRTSSFLLLGGMMGLLSTLSGATGPIMNVFYLNYGLDKESLVGTKAFNSMLLALVQFFAFVGLGFFNEVILYAGIVTGIGAIIGNYLGKYLLGRISEVLFRKAVLAVLLISGASMLWSAIGV